MSFFPFFSGKNLHFRGFCVILFLLFFEMKRLENLMMKEWKQVTFTEERALFGENGLRVTDCVFEKGESPLKEAKNAALSGTLFRWKYPLWYCENVTAENCVWFEMARAGVWYSKNVDIRNTVVQAPKNFRRCDGLKLRDVAIPHAAETLWNCRNVELKNVTVTGDYFAMGCENITAENLTLTGNYGFDGVKNVTVRNSRLVTKDAFWNCENVTVCDSFISGEYLGWNSRNLTLVNCTVESLQGMCYIDNLTMKNCKLIDTTLAFEYSTVEADITSRVESVLNPAGGTIRAEEIGELILEKDRVDPGKTKIVCREIGKRSDRLVW